MTTDEKYIKSMNILNLIYPESHYITTHKPNTHYYRILDKTTNKSIVYGYYSLSGIEFAYCGDEAFEYLINKLIELDFGIIEIEHNGEYGDLFLYFYDKLKNIDI